MGFVPRCEVCKDTADLKKVGISYFCPVHVPKEAPKQAPKQEKQAGRK